MSSGDCQTASGGQSKFRADNHSDSIDDFNASKAVSTCSPLRLSATAAHDYRSPLQQTAHTPQKITASTGYLSGSDAAAGLVHQIATVIATAMPSTSSLL